MNSSLREEEDVNTELWKLSALGLAAAVARGEVGALEVVDAHLGRIVAVNPAVNAVTNVRADSSGPPPGTAP